MKKMLLIATILLSLGLAPHVFAQNYTQSVASCPPGSEFCAIAPIPGLTDGSISMKDGLAVFFNNLYKYLIGLAAVLAVIQITWSGIEIAMNKEDVGKIMDDKGKIYNAIYGLILVLSPALVFSIINPNILNLSLNLPPLDTSYTPFQASSGTMSGAPVTRTTSGTGAWIDLYRCTDQGSCSKAQADCRAAGGIDGQSYCVDSNNNIDASGKKITFTLQTSCVAGDVFAIKCAPKSQ